MTAVPTSAAAETNIRRRLVDLEAEVAHERQQEIVRALDYKSHGNARMAAYHTGLADGRNSTLVALRALIREYPEGVPSRHERLSVAEVSHDH